MVDDPNDNVKFKNYAQAIQVAGPETCFTPPGVSRHELLRGFSPLSASKERSWAETVRPTSESILADAIIEIFKGGNMPHLANFCEKLTASSLSLALASISDESLRGQITTELKGHNIKVEKAQQSMAI
jgi:hypothetical protein